MTKLLFILLLLFGNFAFSQCQGDVNEDYNIDILDVMVVIDHILGNNELAEELIPIADMNSDSNIDVFDIITLVYIIVMGGNEVEGYCGITETDSDGNLIGNIDPDDWCEFEFDMEATDSDFGLNPVYPNPLSPQEWGPFGNSYRVCYQYSTPFDSTWSNFNNIDINIISFENDTIYSYNDEYANGQIAICSYIAADSVVVNSIYRMYMSSDEYNCHGDIQFEE